MTSSLKIDYECSRYGIEEITVYYVLSLVKCGI
jgi:hypothetical protein